MSQRSRTRSLAGLVAVTLTSGSVAGLAALDAAPAFAGGTATCTQPSQTFAAGSQGTFVVPAGATTVSVVASGAGAVAGRYSGAGGSGATVTTTLSVSPGQSLDYAVGTSGDQSNGGLSGTSPSGGRAASGGYDYGSGGGGATFVSSSGTTLVAAGGGGGAGFYSNGGNAGPASSTSTSGVWTGGTGYNQDGLSPAYGGSTTPGAGAIGDNTGTGYHGSGFSGSGQVGGDSAASSGGGGGGGGYQGGGGGAWYQSQVGGGGAGSSYSTAAYTIVGHSGAGSLTLTASPVDPLFQSASTATFPGGHAGSFTVCAPGGTGTTITESGTLPAGVTFTDNGNGTATLAGTTADLGAFPVSFTSTSSGGTETQSFELDVVDVTATSLQVTVSPSTVTAGSNNVPVTVTAYDAQGHVATYDQDPLTLVNSDSNGSVPSVSLVNGVASFTATMTTSGSATLTVHDLTSEGDVVGVSNAVSVSPGPLASYSVGLLGAATAGQSVDVSVSAQDAYGNLVSDTEQLALSSTDSRLVAPASITVSNGWTTTSVTFKTAGTQTLTASQVGGGTVTGTSQPFAVAGAAPVTLVLTAPGSVAAGSSRTLTVTPQDAYGNATSTDDVLHVVSSDPRAVLPADAAWSSLASGQFDATLGTPGSQTISVSDVTHQTVSSATATVTVSAGAASAIALHGGDGQSVPAGHAFGTPLSVLVTDAVGNPVSGEQVQFVVAAESGASFGGHLTDTVTTGTDGVATETGLTAGTSVGRFGVDVSGAGTGYATFVETVAASDASAATTPVTSSGTGTATQSVTIPVPAGGSITLLDASGQPVSQVVTPQGTYTLDPTTGVITFVAVSGFSGMATPVTYQVTDAYHLQASGTYTPSVTAPAPVAPPTVAPPTATPHPGVAHLHTASHVVLTGTSFSTFCNVTGKALRSCRTTLTARVAKRLVVIGTSATVKATHGATSVKTIVRLNALGRALAAQVGGVRAVVTTQVVTTDGRTLTVTAPVSLVDKHVIVPGALLFGANSTTLTGVERAKLKAVRAHLGAGQVVTCVGFTDSIGSARLNLEVGRARAEAACAALVRPGVKVIVVTRGLAHPVADNRTAAGRAQNRRVEITVTY